MRQIFLDTETTGLYPDQGHRIIEIAGVELIHRRRTNNHFHVYLNPERDIDEGAQEVHGISSEFLQDKPLFSAVVEDFLAFVKGAELVIHNAPFDMGFLNMEMERLNYPRLDRHVGGVVDTLKMAKAARPGQRNNLDALCKHFGIDNSKRTLHGALLDAELLADVYIAMTRGQESLLMDLQDHHTSHNNHVLSVDFSKIKVQRCRNDELESHQAYIENLLKSGANLW